MAYYEVQATNNKGQVVSDVFVDGVEADTYHHNLWNEVNHLGYPKWTNVSTKEVNEVYGEWVMNRKTKG